MHMWKTIIGVTHNGIDNLLFLLCTVILTLDDTIHVRIYIRIISHPEDVVQLSGIPSSTTIPGKDHFSAAWG